MTLRALPVLALLLASGCYDQPVSDNFGSTTPKVARPSTDNSTLDKAETPVRIGELGRSFAACNAQGAVNTHTAADGISVRAAPFDQARETGRLAPGAGFFICTRSLDQRWMGVVYGPGGRADRSCGVSAPVPSRRDYGGPCEAGWVPSAQVRLTSGVEVPAGEPSGNIVQPK
jgi:hypothetical protein